MRPDTTRRRAMALLVALLGAMLSLGCATLAPGPGSRSDTGILDHILAAGELRVGLTGAQPPLNMRNRQGEIIGFEVDIARALADSMGLEMRLVPLPFTDLLGALERREVDLVISGMTITVERNARAAFVGPYLVSGKSLLTKSAVLAEAHSVSDLDRTELSYAALSGSTSEAFVVHQLSKAAIRGTEDYESAMKLLRQGEVDAIVADFPFCMLSKLRYPEDGFATLPSPLTVEPLGIALPSGDPLFMNLVQNYVRTLQETGLLARLKSRWFADGSWVSELP